MIENTLRNLGGIGIYGIISVCLFFAFFTGMLVWAFRLKRGYLDSMQDLPLDREATAPPPREPSNRGREQADPKNVRTNPPPHIGASPPPHVGGYPRNDL